MLEFMYCGFVQLPRGAPSVPLQLLQLARRYEVRQLHTLVLRHLHNTLSLYNLPEVRER